MCRSKLSTSPAPSLLRSNLLTLAFTFIWSLGSRCVVLSPTYEWHTISTSSLLARMKCVVTQLSHSQHWHILWGDRNIQLHSQLHRQEIELDSATSCTFYCSGVEGTSAVAMETWLWCVAVFVFAGFRGVRFLRLFLRAQLRGFTQLNGFLVIWHNFHSVLGPCWTFVKKFRKFQTVKTVLCGGFGKHYKSAMSWIVFL